MVPLLAASVPLNGTIKSKQGLLEKLPSPGRLITAGLQRKSPGGVREIKKCHTYYWNDSAPSLGTKMSTIADINTSIMKKQ